MPNGSLNAELRFRPSSRSGLPLPKIVLTEGAFWAVAMLMRSEKRSNAGAVLAMKRVIDNDMCFLPYNLAITLSNSSRSFSRISS